MITKTTSKNKILEFGKECNQCGHCCSFGSGYLAEDDMKKISKFLKISEEKLKEKYLEEVESFHTRLWRPKILRKDKPYGPCIFLKNKKCSIHKVKPLQCRVVSYNSEHKEKLSLWFMLNYIINENDPESLRQYAAYLRAGLPTLKGGQLNDLIPDKNKLKKILNFEVLK